jgi:hypothetical protein
VPVVLVTPRRSPLRELAVPGVLGVVGGDDDAELLAKLLDGVERHVVLVDDAELLLDTALDDLLGRLARAARDADQAVVAAGTTADLSSQYRGFVVDLRRSRSGLLLSPQSQGDGDLLGVRLPRNMAAGPLGRGLLVVNGAVTRVPAARPARCRAGAAGRPGPSAARLAGGGVDRLGVLVDRPGGLVQALDELVQGRLERAPVAAEPVGRWTLPDAVAVRGVGVQPPDQLLHLTGVAPELPGQIAHPIRLPATLSVP